MSCAGETSLHNYEAGTRNRLRERLFGRVGVWHAHTHPAPPAAPAAAAPPPPGSPGATPTHREDGRDIGGQDRARRGAKCERPRGRGTRRGTDGCSENAAAGQPTVGGSSRL